MTHGRKQLLSLYAMLGADLSIVLEWDSTTLRNAFEESFFDFVTLQVTVHSVLLT